MRGGIVLDHVDWNRLSRLKMASGDRPSLTPCLCLASAWPLLGLWPRLIQSIRHHRSTRTHSRAPSTTRFISSQECDRERCKFSRLFLRLRQLSSIRGDQERDKYRHTHTDGQTEKDKATQTKRKGRGDRLRDADSGIHKDAERRKTDNCRLHPIVAIIGRIDFRLY